MKLMKGLLSAFAVVLATTACAGNSGENKKSNESTKEDNKNKHYFCRDKMSIHPLKTDGKGINYVGAIIFSN